LLKEVRRAREAYAAQFEFDLKAIFDDLRRRHEDDATNHWGKCPHRSHHSRGWLILRVIRIHVRDRFGKYWADRDKSRARSVLTQ